MRVLVGGRRREGGVAGVVADLAEAGLRDGLWIMRVRCDSGCDEGGGDAVEGRTQFQSIVGGNGTVLMIVYAQGVGGCWVCMRGLCERGLIAFISVVVLRTTVLLSQTPGTCRAALLVGLRVLP